MTRRELLDRLNAFEADYPVQEWTIDGIQMWPVIKRDVFFDLVRFEDKDAVLRKEPRKNHLKGAKIKKIIKVVISLFCLLRLVLKPRSKVPAILFSDSRGHRVTYHNKLINRYFQPMMEYVDSMAFKLNHVFLNNDTKFDDYPGEETIQFIHKYKDAFKIIDKFKKKRKKQLINLPQFTKFLSAFPDRELQVNSHQYKSQLLRNAGAMTQIRFLTDLIIKKHNIIVIFELCYYSDLRYALNVSARKNKIPVFEIQHGGMGPEHVSYSGWNNLPAEGYNTMPRTFWTWDTASYELINTWVKKQQFHKVILGGNPWIAYLLQNKDAGFAFPKDKKIILYTLQYSEIEPYILETIKNTPADYQWWIRLHPRKTSAKKHIQAALRKCYLDDKVEIDKATAYPLPVILMHSSLHLSGSSGSIIEAAQLGVISLILAQSGLSYYRAYVDQGIAIPETSQSADALLDKIKQFSRERNKDYLSTMSIHNSYKDILDEVLKKKLA